MKLHANENIEAEVVAYLRSLGHDVTYAAEISPRAEDQVVLDFASRQGRILLTCDKDFGELCFRGGRPACGVILIRSRDVTPEGRVRLLRGFLESHAASVEGSFAVLTDGRTRIRRLTRRPP